MNVRFRNGSLLAILMVACLTCMGCFCVERDALPPDQGEHLKAIPEGVWITHEQGTTDQEEQEESKMILTWDESQRAYVALEPETDEPESMLIRFYSLDTLPYYAVLAANQEIVEEDAECPAALFLGRIQEGSLELLLPAKVDEAQHEALMQSCGVSMQDMTLSGTPEGFKAYLLGLSEMGSLTVLQRYEYAGAQ